MFLRVFCGSPMAYFVEFQSVCEHISTICIALGRSAIACYIVCARYRLYTLPVFYRDRFICIVEPTDVFDPN
jgi:hypothetical protein